MAPRPSRAFIFMACAALLAACAPAPSGAQRSDGAEPPAAPRELHLALGDTLPRSASFAGVEFTVAAAEITNVPPLSFSGEPTPGPLLIARLHLVATASAVADLRYPFRNEAFWLQTYSGQLIPSADETGMRLDLNLTAGGTAEDDLYYLVPSQRSLIGATLLIGVPPDAREQIPLTGNEIAAAFPVRIGPAGDSTVHVGPIEWEVVSATLGLDLPAGVCCPDTGSRANEGEAFLTLALEGVVSGSRYGQASVTSNDVELLVDGQSVGEPFGFSGQANVKEGEAYAFEATWLIPRGSAVAVRFSSSAGDAATVRLEEPES